MYPNGLFDEICGYCTDVNDFIILVSMQITKQLLGFYAEAHVYFQSDTIWDENLAASRLHKSVRYYVKQDNKTGLMCLEGLQIPMVVCVVS